MGSNRKRATTRRRRDRAILIKKPKMDENNPLNTGNGQVNPESQQPIQLNPTTNPAAVPTPDPSMPTPISNPTPNPVSYSVDSAPPALSPLPEQSGQTPVNSEKKGKLYIMIAIIGLAAITIGYVVYAYFIKGPSTETETDKTDSPPGIEFSFDNSSKDKSSPDELESVVGEIKDNLAKEAQKETIESNPPSLKLKSEDSVDNDDSSDNLDSNPTPPNEDAIVTEETVTTKISR